MIYLGLLVNITNYVKITSKDIIYYAGLMFVISIIALGFNNIFDCNLMFISQDFPGTPIHILYTICGNWFTFWMIFLQATVPFYVVYLVLKIIKNTSIT